MGCWNKTCGLSRLHITVGTPVLVFVLEDKRSYSDCYTNWLFRPLLLPFDSVYNDYGGGEDSSGPAFALIMDQIKQQLVEVPQGKNQYHDIPVTRDQFGEELFFNAIHEHRLSIIPHTYCDPVPLNFVMFRKDVVDHLLENHHLSNYVGEGKGTHGWGQSYIKYKFSDVVAEIPAMVEFIRDQVFNLTDAQTAWHRIYAVDDAVGRLNTAENLSPVIAYWMRRHYDHSGNSRLVTVQNLIRRAVEQNTDEGYQQLATLLTEYFRGFFLNDFMDEARILWCPGGFEGSQSTGEIHQRLLCNAIIQVLDQEREELGDMDDMDDEDDHG